VTTGVVREGSAAAPPWASESVARAVLFAVPVVLAFVWVRIQLATHGEIGFPLDDSYIHFQFARNLGTGHGFAFNPDEPTPGATSPLWVAFLGLLRAVGFSVPATAVVIGVAFTGVAGVLANDVARKAGWSRWTAFLAGLATVMSGRMTWGAISGMEIALATLTGVAVVRAQQSNLEGIQRGALLGLLVGLAGTARPEMMLLAPMVLALEVWRDRRRVFVVAAAFVPAFVLIASPYMVFCLATTGRPLPNTYYIKSLIELANDPSLPKWRASYLPLAWTFAAYDNPAFGLLLLPGILVWAWRRDPRSALVALWPVVFCIYALIAYPRHFSLSRYTIPLVPFYALLSMAALEATLARWTRPAVRRAGIVIASVLVIGASLLSQINIQRIHLANVDNILKMHVAIGRWVAQHTPPEARIALNDVGAITYIGQRYCIDTVGLVSSDRVTFTLDEWRAHGHSHPDALLPRYLQLKRPDYCILFPSWYPALVQEPWLQYITHVEYPNNTGGGNEMVVYRVAGLAPAR
jgi:hypothetical protein